MTVAPAVAWPERVGVASSVTLPLARSPWFGPTLSSACSMLMATALVSTMKLIGVLTGLWLPAASTTTVLKL
ncbi:hypothetical protein D3C80_2152660 [compost metagenome]